MFRTGSSKFWPNTILSVILLTVALFLLNDVIGADAVNLQPPGRNGQMPCAASSAGAVITTNGSIFSVGEVGSGQLAGGDQRAGLGIIYCLGGGSETIDGCPTTCGQLAGGADIDLIDFWVFQACFGQSPSRSVGCLCADLDGSGLIDLEDYAAFVELLGQESLNTPPNCP